MKKTRYILWIVAVEFAGILSAVLSRQGMMFYRETVRKPPLTPPGIIFAVVWTVLYALMAIGAAWIDAAPDSRQRQKALNEFIIQLTLNFFWSPIFFNVRSYGLALLWLAILWVFVLRMISAFRKTDSMAAWLQIPYLVWVTFAVYLNYGVWILNP